MGSSLLHMGKFDPYSPGHPYKTARKQPMHIGTSILKINEGINAAGYTHPLILWPMLICD